MSNLVLLKRKRSLTCPAEVQNLVAFLQEYRAWWPVVADYLREVPYRYDKTKARQKLDALVEEYFMGDDDPTERESLWSLLTDVYALSDRHADPRGLVIQCLLFVVGPVSRLFGPNTRREIECAVHTQEEASVTPLVEGESSFDVAFLDRRFEGHECKVKASNFIPFGKPFDEWDALAKSKIQFMRQTHEALAQRGIRSMVFVASVERRLEPVVMNLAANGFGMIDVLGADDLEEMLAS